MASENALVFSFLARDRGVGKQFDKLADKSDGLSHKLGRAGKTAALALGGAAVAGVGLLTKGLIDGAQAAMRYEVLAKKTAAVIKSTGNVAGISVKGVQALAGELESMSGVDEELIINAQNVLATFTGIRNVGKNKIFDEATKSALDMSVALGTDLQGASIMVGKALNNPIKGVTALQRVGVSFTEAQKKQIEALVKSGRVMDAQKLILKELQTEFGGAAKAAGDTFTGKIARAQDAIGDFARDMGAKVLPAVGLLSDWVSNVGVPKLREFADWLQNKGVPAIRDGVKRAGEEFGKLAVKLKLPQIGKNLFANAKAWAQQIIDGIQTGIQTGDWSKLGKTLGEALRMAISTTSAGFGKVADAIGKWAGSIDWLQAGKKVGAQAAPFVIGFVNTLMDPLFTKEFWQKNWKEVIFFAINFIPFGRGGSFASRIAKRLGLGDGIIGGVIKSLEGVIGKPLGAVLKVARWMAGKFWEGFKTAFPALGKALRGGLVDDIIYTIWYAVEDAGKAVSGVFEGILKSLGAAVGRVIVEAGKGAWMIVRAIAAPFWQSGKLMAEPLGYIFRIWASEFVTAVKWAGGWGLNVVRGLSGGLWSGIRTLVTPLWYGIRLLAENVATWPGRLASKASEIGLRIKAAILKGVSKFDTVLHQAGQQLIQGLVNGWNSTVDNIKRKVTDLANWVRNQLAHIWDTHSPSRMTEWFGKMLGAGLVKGLDSSQGAVSRSVTDLAGAANGLSPRGVGGRALSLAGTSPGLGMLGGSGATVNVTVDATGAVISSAKQFEDMVYTGLQAVQRKGRLRVKVV